MKRPFSQRNDNHNQCRFFVWLGICVEVDVERITILSPLPLYLPPYILFLSLPTILSLIQVTVIWN